MNREDIVRMAKNSGLFVELVLERDLDWLERFAALVASAEREACAKSLEEAAQAAKNADPQGFVWIAIKTSAEGIRARGKA